MSSFAWCWTRLWSKPACDLCCSWHWPWLWCVARHTGPFDARGRSLRGACVWSVGVASSSWIWPSAGTGSWWLSIAVLHTAPEACTQWRSCRLHSFPELLAMQCGFVHDDELVPAVHFLKEGPYIAVEGLFGRRVCHEYGSVHTDDGGELIALEDQAEGHEAIRVSHGDAHQLAGQHVLQHGAYWGQPMIPCAFTTPVGGVSCSVLREWPLFGSTKDKLSLNLSRHLPNCTMFDHFPDYSLPLFRWLKVKFPNKQADK